ncbi:hypothetical protein [Salinibacterium sp. TMP30]|uniref:hypothetical protein n=1 Tax=Salinibacterium sp. TMP30 TaxID=3138237 RepID=UPI0031396B9B
MNRHSVNDLVECSLQRWYRTVSQWRRPVGGTPTGCVACRSSDFAVFDRLGHWPHDLIHSLVETLDLVSMQLAVALHEERHCANENGRATAPCNACIAQAQSTANSCAQRHAQDIADVVNECAMPRLAVYVEMNTNLALNAATRGEWAS